MDMMALLRTLGALGLVLGGLAAALWVVRRYDLSLPGRVGGSRQRRVELIERLPLDAKRSIALIRRDGQEHLILIGPEGHVMIETAITPETAPATPPVTAEAPATPVSVASREGFGVLVERARARVAPTLHVEPVRHPSRRRLTGVAKRAARRVAAGA